MIKYVQSASEYNQRIVNKIWDKLEQMYKGSEITPEVVIDYVQEHYPRKWKSVLDTFFSPENYEWYDEESANDWYDEILREYNYKIPGLPIEY